MGALQASLFDLGVCPVAQALDALSGSTCFSANMQQLAECCRRCHPTCSRVRVSARGYAANCAMLLLHMPAARIMCAGGFVPSYCSSGKAERPDEGDSLHYCLLLLATCTQRRPLDIHRTPAALCSTSRYQHKLPSDFGFAQPTSSSSRSFSSSKMVMSTPAYGRMPSIEGTMPR